MMEKWPPRRVGRGSPISLKDELCSLKDRKTRAHGGKEHWAKLTAVLEVYDDVDGLRNFDRMQLRSSVFHSLRFVSVLQRQVAHCDSDHSAPAMASFWGSAKNR
jgi:hypothetical protein